MTKSNETPDYSVQKGQHEFYLTTGKCVGCGIHASDPSRGESCWVRWSPSPSPSPTAPEPTEFNPADELIALLEAAGEYQRRLKKCAEYWQARKAEMNDEDVLCDAFYHKVFTQSHRHFELLAGGFLDLAGATLKEASL